MFAEVSKFLFHVSSVEYLGYIVSSEGLYMDNAKVQKIHNLPPQKTSTLFNNSLVLQTSTSISSRIIQRLLVDSQNSSKKDSIFLLLNEEGLRHFHQLKKAFTTFPILSHFNSSLPTIVETDASDYGLGSVLSQ
ncbi:hypothetical protein O181_049751 [Austropuccinia psidii MF-1]|uniref:Reverse transcriptase/retrotransposon-derived protein RNase H-like domain-containing protein n=1 Tax=Austropuccinia psidii MF-1 TaxID=1389203 RepID=A0A9Q3E0I2_9BASI|nr:hypothetical protein [Austropuccinia psidii MF-1]